MDKGRVIETLRAHQDELRAAGVVRLSVFGSVARGEASQQSDVDLMADFDRSKRLTLVKIGSLQAAPERMAWRGSRAFVGGLDAGTCAVESDARGRRCLLGIIWLTSATSWKGSHHWREISENSQLPLKELDLAKKSDHRESF